MSLSEKIRCRAYELGFDLCGIAACHPMSEHYEAFQKWLDAGYDGGLEHLHRNAEKRFDPTLLYEQARSVIVCGVSYHRPHASGEVASRIAAYAHSVDYHITIKQQLFRLLDYLKELKPEAAGRVFTDTAPISEKSWAVEAGLGWIGRHSLLIHPRLGSFLLLGEIVTTVGLDPDNRKLPEVRGGLSGQGDSARPEDRRRKVYCPQDDRTGTGRKNGRGSAWMGFRLRRMSAGVSLQP